jgi:hypothetical protein
MDELESLDLLTRDLYASISFTPGRHPDLNRLKSLFLPPGKLINNNEEEPLVWDVEAFAEIYRHQIATGAVASFAEEEITGRTDIFANIAHRFSTYQARVRAGDSEAVILGINSIQFIKTQGVWRVVSIVWNDQKEDRPIPEKYL